MDPLKKAFEPAQRNSEAMMAFGYRLKNQFIINESHRRAKELEWLESLRQYKGIYDPTVNIQPGNSRVYPKITRSKVNIVLSRLHEMLFPETDKNWEIEPTPDPKIDQQVVMQIAMSLVQENPETGELVLPKAEDLNIAIKDYAEERAKAMSVVMDDQLTEMKYSEEVKKVLRSGLMYGTGIMKGVMIDTKELREWETGRDGNYVEIVKTEDMPIYEFVRLWDWYPDMSVTDLDKIEGSFEYHVMSRHELRMLMRRDDFYREMITAHLIDHPNGDYVPKNWEVDLQTIEVEAGATNSARPLPSGTTTTYDTQATNRQLGKKYQVLEFWGYVDGADLAACGLQIDDPSLEYAANVWLLGNRPIKAVLYDGALTRYKVFYYEKDETSLFGEGLARIMRHSQLSISAGARMVLDNGACVAGPNVEANVDLLSPDTDIDSFYARKIWLRGGRGVEAQYPAVRSVEFSSHIEELLSIIEAFKQFGDEETTLPTWMIGQMVNNETAQATSGRMATITISIKDVVKNFDTFTESIMRDLYAWNMEFNPRPEIKGDFKCKAKGVSSLVMKEIRMQALNQLSTTLTPEDWVYIPRREFLEDKFRAHDINIRLRTEEEADKIRQEQRQSEEVALAIEMQKAEIAYKKAQTMAQLTKAKDKNIEAQIKAATPIEEPQGTDPRLNDEALALAMTDRAAKEQEMRRAEEAHALEMSHKEDAHAATMAMDTTKAAQDIAIKGRMFEHDMALKERQAKESAELKKSQSKQKGKPGGIKS